MASGESYVICSNSDPDGIYVLDYSVVGGGDGLLDFGVGSTVSVYSEYARGNAQEFIQKINGGYVFANGKKINGSSLSVQYTSLSSEDIEFDILRINLQ